MFNRFKSFNLDTFLEGKLAEDEAKKAQQQGQPAKSSAKRTPSAVRRGSGRGGTPSGKRESSRLRVPEGGSPLPARSPDPEDFVIGDDASDISAISRAATPKPVKEGEDGPILEEKKEGMVTEQDASTQQSNSPEKQDEVTVSSKGKEKATAADEELPLEVRRKLAKLDTLTTKYNDLLRNYRLAHSRVTAIEPFEATLREHTSLTSIADPGALVEFMEARTLQKDMVMDELRRVTGEHDSVVKERDELKVKLEDAEKKAKEAFDEAAGLKKERGAAKNEADESTEEPADSETPVETDTSRGPPTEDETFYDYDTELSSLQGELQEQKTKIDEQTAYINELSDENANLRQSQDVVNLDLSAMYNKVDVKEREIVGLRTELKEAAEAKKAAEDQKNEASACLTQVEGRHLLLQEKLQMYSDNVEKQKKDLQDKLDASERKYQLEHDGEQQEKRKQFQDTILSSMREQLQEAQEAKSISEGRYKDLELEFNRISSECDNKGGLITKLRGQEDANKSLRERNVALESERDKALHMMDSKKQHESAAVSLRSQLKRTERDRDDAYQMILKCGQCQKPTQNGEAVVEGATQADTPATRSRRGSETTEKTEASTQPTEVSTPPAEAEAPVNSEAKKKNKNKKKKSKAKKDVPEAGEAMKTEEQDRPKPEAPASKPEDQANHHLKFLMDKIQKSTSAEEELTIRERDQTIREKVQTIQEQDQTIRGHLETIEKTDGEIANLNGKLEAEQAEVEKLSGKLKDQEALTTELDELRDTLADLGKENTDFKHERKTASDSTEAVQKELDQALAEEDKLRKTLEDAESRRLELVEENKKLQEEIERERNDAAAGSSAMIASAEKQRDTALENLSQATELQKRCEKQIEGLQTQIKANESDTADWSKLLQEKLTKVESEKSRAEKELAAANSLAQTRYKDLTELKEHTNKLQAEHRKAKDEAAELRGAKEDLEKSNASLKKLEAKEKDLRSEISEYKSQITEKDAELAGLKDKVKKGDERSTALEDTYEGVRKDLENSEKTRDDAIDARDKAQAGQKKVEGELRSAKSTREDLQKQVVRYQDEVADLRKELDSKKTLLASSQSQAGGYQDQQREMAAQLKEHRDRADALDEELAEVHRLLSERGREGETMRRLIEDVKNERDRKVKEMQEERDRAMEERDRADDEASTIGRRKAKEIQELKTKLSKAEKDASRAKEARDEADRREREFRSFREELERRAAKAEEDNSQRRDAMAQMQQSLDDSQRERATVEKERGDYQRLLDESKTRLEKSQKSAKAMAEELAASKAGGGNKVRGPVANSARTSADSSRVTSPAPPPRGGGVGGGAALGDDMINRAVIRSTLLNFMQQKDKRVQMSMVGPGGPLAKMLGFGREDEQSWMAAVSTR